MSKVIVITGASRGIGAATARLAGARGWSVVVNYTSNRQAADDTVAAVEKAGAKALAVQGDVSVEADVIGLFDTSVETYGRIDGVVSNAGIMIAPPLPLADIPMERLQRTMNINFLGGYLVAREAIRRMALSRGGKGGVIVNLSSAAARLGSAGEYVDYAGTKGAIDTMTIGLAKEVGGDGIRVNAVRPGLIETDIHVAAGSPDRMEKSVGTVPMGRPGTPEETAEAIIWLLSDAASYVNGTILEVTGGR